MPNVTIASLHETIQAYLPETAMQHHQEERPAKSFDDLIRLVHSLTHPSEKKILSRR